MATAAAHRAVKNKNFSTILQRVARADKSAVGECIETYGNLVWAAARKFSPTMEDAERTALEIFRDIWKSAARFDPARHDEDRFVLLIACRRLIKDYSETNGNKSNDNVARND